MIVLLSPSKTMQLSSGSVPFVTDIRFASEMEYLVGLLKAYSPEQIQKLMSVSENLATATYQLYQDFDVKLPIEKKVSAIHAFKGDVYTGLEASSFNDDDLVFAHHSVRILSGLYGVLRPLDGMAPYRLEMGSRLETQKGSNLYHFWGEKITSSLQKDIEEFEHRFIINLASKEYFKSLSSHKLNVPIIEVEFYQLKNGVKTFASVFAKKARGLMASFIIKERIDNPAHLAAFDKEGYYLDTKNSSNSHFVFVR